MLSLTVHVEEGRGGKCRGGVGCGGKCRGGVGTAREETGRQCSSEELTSFTRLGTSLSSLDFSAAYPEAKFAMNIRVKHQQIEESCMDGGPPWGWGVGGGRRRDLETLGASGSFWQLGEELQDQVLTTSIQQPVCFIQHKKLDCVRGQLARLYEVHDAPCTPQVFAVSMHGKSVPVLGYDILKQMSAQRAGPQKTLRAAEVR